ncbi:MAG: serine acetyltransferase, partial [Myxococcota bacterium]
VCSSDLSVVAVSAYRIAHSFYVLDERIVARIMSRDAHSKTGIDIHPGAQIGHHFFIDHGTGVVIGETCILGNHVKLYHGVTLGAYSNRAGRADVGSKRHPTLENDVTVYPNATILGGNTVIGEGSIIGGNVWLTHSVPKYTRVNAEPPSLQLHQKPPPGIGEGI